jgi:hypothetical protein
VLLIYGDLMRATWYFIFSVVSFVNGIVESESSFCQTSGFFMQYGESTSGTYRHIILDSSNVISDYAVLIIAVHSALQVFHSSTQTTSDGLHTYRAFVYVGAFLVPCLTAGLAFVNSGAGYSSLGAFCTLPIRPFWYRLALAWIPRYLIALIIMGLALAINAFVGFKFRKYTQMSQRGQTSQSTRLPRVSYGKKPVSSEDKATATNCPSLVLDTHTEPITGECVENTQLLDDPFNFDEQVSHQRLRVRRQLRLMFIYPLVYTLMWLLPFAHHCTMYFDRYVQRPIWFLRLGAAVCMSSMGFVDCLVFSLREKPWQHISPEDGWPWESLKIWKSIKSTRHNVRSLLQGRSAGRGLALSKRLTTRRPTGAQRTSSSDDYARKAKQARVRLELERRERHTAVRVRAGDLHSESSKVDAESVSDRDATATTVG